MSDLSYAVPYSPATIPSRRVCSFLDLRARGIRYIRFQYVDPTNNVRYRVIPISHFEHILEGPRPSISITKAGLGSAFLSLAEGFFSHGEYIYTPDLSTVRILPYKPGHASVLGWFEEKVPLSLHDGTLTTQAQFCPRGILHGVVEHAKVTSGVEFLVGFEIEFVLLTSTSPVTPVHMKCVYSNSLALPTGCIAECVLEQIVEALEESGIEVHMYHAEASFGQYEIVTGPLPPLQAVDALVHTRETIYNIASKNGLRATLAPQIHKLGCGTASHAHISVHPTDRGGNSPSPRHANLTISEESFLAGLLSELPAVSAMTLPLPASFERVADGVFTGGTYVCWGTDNREVPIRLCNATSPSSRNFEIKTLDGTANPYFALTAILGAGHEGIDAKSQLVMKDCAGPSASMQGEGGRKELGITQRMPLTWEEARDNLKQSHVLRKVFGVEVIEKFLSVNMCMAQALDAPVNDEEKLMLLVENY